MPAANSAAIVTSEGRSNDRSALATVRALAAAGYLPVVAVSGGNSLAAASRYVHETVRVPRSDDPAFAAEVVSVARQRNAIHVFATSDAALIALHPEVLALMDKATLGPAAAASGLATPESRAFETKTELQDAAGDLGYPVIVKPKLKLPGGPAAVQVFSEVEIGSLPAMAGVVQPYLAGPTRALAGVVWSGQLIASVQQRYERTYPAGAGTASEAFTEAVNAQWSASLLTLLQHYQGIFQAQFVGDRLIDLNLRPYGSMPLALGAGLNLPALVCRLSEGHDIVSSEAAIGVRYRWIDGDVRSLITEVRSGDRSPLSVLAAVLPRRGTCHSIVSIRDPGPTMVRLRRRSGGPS